MKPSTSKLVSIFLVICAVMLGIFYLPTTSHFPRTKYGPVIHEETSDFSKIRVRGFGQKRYLLFVDKTGREGLQSSIDLEDPGTLQVAYTKTLFASLLFRNPQEKVLVVGLGGGGMIRFIDENHPETTVEAVEIDPAVVRIAAEHFGTQENERVTIHTADAFVFLKQENQYDAIYMDAFLRPSVDGDPEGSIAQLKKETFLKTIRDRLVADGVLACNLITHRNTTKGDIAALRKVFPQVKKISVPGTGNLVVIASKREWNFTEEEWIAKGSALEKSNPVGLPFSEFAKRMR